MTNEFMDKFKRNPLWPVKEMEAEMMDKYGAIVHNCQCYKARQLAQKIIKGTLEEHYGKVRRYSKEEMMIDPNGSFILQAHLDETTNKSIFKRVYVGYNMLRNGFRQWCRQIIGLMEHFLNQSLVVHYLLQLGKTMIIGCFLLVGQWSRVKTKDLGHCF